MTAEVISIRLIRNVHRAAKLGIELQIFVQQTSAELM